MYPKNYIADLINNGEERFQKYMEMYERAGIVLTEEDKVLCLCPNYYVIYTAFPATVGIDWSARDGEIEPEEWVAQIRDEGYNYLLIEKYGRFFVDTYQDLFEGGKEAIKEWAAYEIVVNDDDERFRLLEKTL